jgi:hypothetical protein
MAMEENNGKLIKTKSKIGLFSKMLRSRKTFAWCKLMNNFLG